MKTLILGLGNDIAGDDGAGIRIAEELARMTAGHTDVTVETAAAGGFNIIPLIEGYSRVFIVDSLRTSPSSPGRLHIMDISRFKQTFQGVSPHWTNLYTAVEAARRCGMEIPVSVTIFAVEIPDGPVEASESCTPEIERSIIPIAGKIAEYIEKL